MPTDSGSVVLHSSIRGALFGVGAPLMLALVAAAAWWRQPRIGPGLVISVSLAAFLLAVYLLDHPTRAVFGPAGVNRVCPLRHQHLAWGDIDRITRGRGSTMANPRRKEGPSPRAVGPLVAVIGRRRYLLIDQCESRAEYESLRKALGDWEVKVSLAAVPPPMDAPPTGLYRRKRK